MIQKITKNILLLLLLGLILRLINLNQSLWLDEAISALAARDLTAGQILTQFAPVDPHPPLYYLLLHFWGKIFGWSEISMRMPSVFFGVATVYVTYLIGKQLLPKKHFTFYILNFTFVELSALLFATAPFHIYYSQEARMYAMTTFFACLSMYFFVRLTGNQRLATRKKPTTDHRLLVAGYILSTTLLLYSHYFGFFILLAQFLTALILLKKKFFSFFVFQLFSLVIFLPWLPTMLVQFWYGGQVIPALPGLERLINVDFIKALPLTFVKFSIGRITIFNKKLYAVIAGVLFIIYSGVIGKVTSDQYSATRKKKKLDPGYRWLVTIFFWFLIPILSAWLISLFIPNYQPFRLLLVLPAFYLLLAHGASQFRTTIIYIIVVSFVLVVNLGSLWVYYSNPYFHREDWRGLVKYIESQKEKDPVAILPSKTSSPPWQYYSSGKVRLIGTASGIKKVTKEDLNNLTIEQFNNRTIYYIRYLVPLFDPQEKTSSWLDENGFAKIKEISFNQIPVWEYGRIQKLEESK